jgi:CTP:phosphocholine cytidylyltransferase-like protein/thiamine kinase-like enzyme
MEHRVELLRELLSAPLSTQRELAGALGRSLGSVNQLVNSCIAAGLLSHTDGTYRLTAAGKKLLEQYKVDNASILAAGFGSRFLPLTFATHKGLLKVKGQPMLERQIEQLLEVGISEIIIVVGYLKEQFDYLIDKYGVTLIYNPEYATKNNYASLYCAREHLGSSYILMADNWIKHNMFATYEPSSWTSGKWFDGPTAEWVVELGAHDLITKISIGGSDTWAMLGPIYFSREMSATYIKLLEECYARPGSEDFYFEQIIKDNLDLLPLKINKQSADNIYEFENLDELRTFDSNYQTHSNDAIMAEISAALGVEEGLIHSIEPLKGGMTNDSFMFSVGEARYVFRVPGLGTDKLIDRRVEALHYELVAPYDFTDEVVYFDAASGNRITRFIADARIADANDDADLELSMQMIRKLHDLQIKTEYRFDIAVLIDSYEEFCNEIDAIRFQDFAEVRARADELLELRRKLAVPEVLCHADYANVNVLIAPDGKARLIDWEYSGAADPLMDVAMYGIFSYFDRERLELSLRMYLEREPDEQELVRLYLYVALGGFLWSMWAEYKQALGQDFDEYPLVMYRYMKEYYGLMHNA